MQKCATLLILRRCIKYHKSYNFLCGSVTQGLGWSLSWNVNLSQRSPNNCWAYLDIPIILAHSMLNAARRRLVARFMLVLWWQTLVGPITMCQLWPTSNGPTPRLVARFRLVLCWNAISTQLWQTLIGPISECRTSPMSVGPIPCQVAVFSRSMVVFHPRANR